MGECCVEACNCAQLDAPPQNPSIRPLRTKEDRLGASEPFASHRVPVAQTITITTLGNGDGEDLIRNIGLFTHVQNIVVVSCSTYTIVDLCEKQSAPRFLPDGEACSDP